MGNPIIAALKAACKCLFRAVSRQLASKPSTGCSERQSKECMVFWIRCGKMESQVSRQRRSFCYV